VSRAWLVAIAVLFVTDCRTRQNATRESAPPQTNSAAARVSSPFSYADIVRAVAPAVVTVRASRSVRVPQQFPFFDSPLFHRFFGGGSRSPIQTKVEQALGSGVIVRPDGHILTNYHVVDGAQEIEVNLSDGRTFSARVVGADKPSDLAVVKVKAYGLSVLQLGDSDKVRVGDLCLALGNPFGVGESVTAGIISAKSRATDTLGSGSFEDFLQTDAAINKGNSGGALVNMRAELIGINSQIVSPNGGGFIGIGFAIPSNMAKNVMVQLIQKGTVQRGMLGMTIQPVTSEIVAGLGLKEIRGVLVNSVNSGGPAAQAGIKPGDVILRVNGKDVPSPNELRNEIAAMSPGTEVALTVSRDGSQRQIRVRLGTLILQSQREGAC
jgi:Do/DeqQ family serine protease